MKMTLHQVDLPLAHPFTISRGTMSVQPSLLVELEHEGFTGFGEVTENSYYGHSYDSMIASLALAEPHLHRYSEYTPLDLWQSMFEIMGCDPFAMSALDIAAHDLHGKRNGIPTWQTWGLSWNEVVPSSYTIGIADIETMITKLNEKPDWRIYKIKLGTDNDLEIIQQLRKHTEATFRVDANCGWSVTQAIDMSKSLAELGVEFIEQPLPPETSEAEKRKLFEQSALPIIADEDCLVAADVEKCDGLFHGVNVKIAKCGGLSPALGMLQEARSRKMQTMLGCMVESSIGISGAAQLLPLLDYADLDGSVLLQDEPVTGVVINDGEVERPESPGCGTEIQHERLMEFSTQS